MSEVIKRPRTIEADQTSDTEIFDLLTSTWSDRLYDPIEDLAATQRLLSQCDDWRSQGKTIVFTSGVYDLMHLKHHGYLIDTKAQAAGTHFDHYYTEAWGTTWQQLSDREQKMLRHEFITDGSLKQVVSVDGNDWVSSRKGNNAEKGGSPRPVLDWQTRAAQVANAMIKVATDSFVPVVDAVTMHDQLALETTPHRDTIDLAALIQPDVWTVFFESTDILDVAPLHPNLQNTNFVCIGPNKEYILDRLIGKFSTTAIVNRIQGK